MKQLLTLLCIAMFFLVLFAGCDEDNPDTKPEAAKPSAPIVPAVLKAVSGKSGKVLEAMDTAGYTYIQVDTGSEKFWAAAPQVAVKVGDDVVVPEGMPMSDYHSKTLDRTFDMVYFVPSIRVAGEENLTGDKPVDILPKNRGRKAVETTDIDLSGIMPAEGGQTIAALFARKADLASKPVKVRGKVVKFSPEIMGKNWIHIQDGTGTAGSNDLTVTTSAVVKKGDTVFVSGVLVIDKDFGYGYAYDVIIEDAEVTVE